MATSRVVSCIVFLLGMCFVALAVGWTHNVRQGKIRSRLDIMLNSVVLSDQSQVVINREGIVMAWSRGATKLYGWEADQVVGYGPSFIIPAEVRARHIKGFRAVADNPSRWNEVSRVVCNPRLRDGSIGSPIEVTTVVVVIGGKPYFRGRILDVSRIKVTELPLESADE